MDRLLDPVWGWPRLGRADGASEIKCGNRRITDDFFFGVS